MKDLFQEMCSSLLPDWVSTDQALAPSIDMGWGRLFGGQLLAQATGVAQQHPSTEGVVHSLHAHFLSTGSVTEPVTYQVHPVRKGRSYSTIRVEGYQADKIIFHAFLSFQLPEEGLAHQSEMPNVPAPDSLPSYQTTLRRMVENSPPSYRETISKTWLKRLYLEAPIDIRPIRPSNFIIPDSSEPERVLWFKAAKELPEQESLHQQLLIWTSDFPMLGAALQPHKIPPMSPKIKVTSLDHCVWFYAPFKADQWLLCRVRSPRSGGGRGLSFAEIWQDGVLVACCSQEGMIRLRKSIRLD